MWQKGAKKVISKAKEAERKKWGEDLDKENKKGKGIQGSEAFG